MKKLGVLILTVALFLGGCKKDNAVVVKEQANQMGQALIKKDFKGFAKFTYPKIAEMMGGQEKMISEMQTGFQQMDAAGYAFEKITIGEPSKIVTAEKELQCIVPQTTVMKVPGGKQTIKSTLIAISTNQGKSWYFVDAAGKTIDQIKAALPNVSNTLVIPPMEEPVFEKG